MHDRSKESKVCVSIVPQDIPYPFYMLSIDRPFGRRLQRSPCPELCWKHLLTSRPSESPPTIEPACLLLVDTYLTNVFSPPLPMQLQISINRSISDDHTMLTPGLSSSIPTSIPSFSLPAGKSGQQRTRVQTISRSPSTRTQDLATGRAMLWPGLASEMPRY